MKGAHTWPPALPNIKFSRWLLLLALLTLRLGGQLEARADRTFFRPDPFPDHTHPLLCFLLAPPCPLSSPPTHTHPTPSSQPWGN